MSNLQPDDDAVLAMYSRPWEWPDCDWQVRAVIPTREDDAPQLYVAMLFRIRTGTCETRYPVELGWHDSEDDAWDYAERLCQPRLH